MDKKRLYHIIEWLIALAACVYLVYRLVLFDDYASLWALMNGDAALNDANDGLSFAEAHRQVYYSKLAGLITPWRLGEYPSRAILMAQEMHNSQCTIHNDDKSKEAGIWSRVLSMGVVGSATMTTAIVVAGLFSIVMLGFLGGLENLFFLDRHYTLFVACSVALLLILLFFAPELLKRWAAVTHGLVLVSTAQSFLRLVCWCVQLALVLWALGVFQLSTFNFQLLPIYYLLITITPNVPIAEAGVRGAWAITIFGSVNAAFAGVILWAVNTLLPCLVWFFSEKKR